MPLPDTPKFEALLHSLTPERPAVSEGWREFVAVPVEKVNLDGKREQWPAISFWYREVSDLRLETVMRKISAELQEAGHLANMELAGVLLGIFAFSTGTGSSAVHRFNELFSRVVAADLNQFHIFPLRGLSSSRIEVGPFSIGPFRPERLAYQSQKARSDFFVRYETDLRNLPFCVEREFRAAKVIFWHKFAGNGLAWSPRSANLGKILVRLVNNYFSELSALHFVEFFDELYRVQELPMALGSGWFDCRRLQELIGSNSISVFLNIGGENVGFVSPIIGTLEINLGGFYSGVPFTEVYLKTKFEFAEITCCEIHQSLQSYCHFLSLALQHRAGGRAAESFLHYVIALDLLLGREGESSASVSKRGALLTYRTRGKSYSQAVKELQRIYSARSKFVQEGRQPDPSLIEQVEEICREIAFCLFRLQNDPANRQAGFHDRWLEDIDFVVAAIEANRPTANEVLQQVGACASVGDSYAEFRRELKRRSS